MNNLDTKGCYSSNVDRIVQGDYVKQLFPLLMSAHNMTNVILSTST